MPHEDLQDLIDALTQTPETVASLIKCLSGRDVRVKHSLEEFSVVENVCHLRDLEVEGYAVRIVRILSENNPLLPDIDGSCLAAEREYNAQNLSEALEAFAEARKQNTKTLRGLVAKQFDRVGTLEGVGSVTIRKLLTMMRDHDADHVRELSTISARVNSTS